MRRDCLDQLLAPSPGVGCRTQLLLGFEQPRADGLQACAHSGVSLINFTEGSSQGRIGAAYLLDRRRKRVLDPVCRLCGQSGDITGVDRGHVERFDASA